MTTQVTILPDNFIHIANLSKPNYDVKIAYQFSIAYGPGHFDEATKTAWFDLGKLGKIPMPILGEVNVINRA